MAVKETKLTLENLNILQEEIKFNYDKVLEEFLKGNLEPLKEFLKGLEKIQAKGFDISKVMKTVKDDLIGWGEVLEANFQDTTKIQEGIKAIDETNKNILRTEENKKKVLETQKKLYADVKRALDGLLKTHQEIYKTSHDMQLEGNITWREFTKLYEEAYTAARKLNDEVGKQLFTAKEMIGVQEKLITQGWKGLDATTLSQVTSAVTLMTKTMGNVDDRLVKAFEGSYKQFGESTSTFLISLGDRLNNFSDSLGVTVGMLQGVVAEMMSSNTFLARNNMQAQLRANESLMQATALVAGVGIETTNFINQLASIAQFGTAEEMSGLFQAGALLQDFSTGEFQAQLQRQEYFPAAEDLISSIHKTLNGMGEGYLRNQYMKTIGTAFGLSQDDLLEIMTHGGDLTELTSKIEKQLEESDKSMQEEIKGLKVAIVDQVEAWWQNTSMSEHLGKFMNDNGLYGLAGIIKTPLLYIAAKVKQIADQKVLGLSDKLSVTDTTSKAAGGTSVFAPVGKGSRLAKIGGGLLIAEGGNIAGSAIQQSNILPSTAAQYTGGAVQTLAGIGGGILAGSAFGVPGMIVGGLAGGAYGLYNAHKDSAKRKEADAIAKEERIKAEKAAAYGQTSTTTNDPVVALLQEISNTTKAGFTGVIGTSQENLKYTMSVDLRDFASTGGVGKK